MAWEGNNGRQQGKHSGQGRLGGNMDKQDPRQSGGKDMQGGMYPGGRLGGDARGHPAQRDGRMGNKTSHITIHVFTSPPEIVVQQGPQTPSGSKQGGGRLTTRLDEASLPVGDPVSSLYEQSRAYVRGSARSGLGRLTSPRYTSVIDDEDIAQDAFVEALEGGQLDMGKNPRAFIATTAWLRCTPLSIHETAVF